MKDFYDLYYFVNYKWKDIDATTLQKAIMTTFKHRDTQDDLEGFEKILNLIEKDETMNVRWKAYQNGFLYAKDIDFKTVIESIRKFENVIL